MSDKGVSVKALENRPNLLPGLDFYINAYNDLAYDRPVAMGVGAIPWSSIIKWCNLHDIYDIDEIGTCIRYIRAMEKTEYELNEKKANKK